MSSTGRTARQPLALPKAERSRILQTQVEGAAEEYEADLALPASERELTAFTALDGDALHDYPRKESLIYNTGGATVANVCIVPDCYTDGTCTL